MGSVVHAAQATAVDVAIELGRRERAVAEQLLDRAQVGTTLEQMGCECMPQAVRMSEDAAEGRRVEAATSCGQEHGPLRPAGELRTCFVQIPREEVARLFAERDDPFLSAFAADMKLLAVEINVRELEADGFRAAEPGRVDQLDESTIPERERPVALQPFERRLDLGGLWTVRQASRTPWSERGVGHL